MKSETADARPIIGLALSGGGFRAAAFHLGVLKRLEELGVLQRIEVLSTVSGGTITGGLYALRCARAGGPPGSYPVDDLIEEMRPFLGRNLRARALLGSPWRALRTAWSFISPRVSRIGLMVEELDRQLYAAASLNELPDWIVINATNLRTGKGWRFFNDVAGDYLIGATDRTSEIRVSACIAASAAYPGLTDSYGFVTRWEHLRGDLLDPARWERPPGAPGSISRWRDRYGRASGKLTLPLADGGLYDNEGMNGLRGRKVTHAIMSAVSPPESDYVAGFGLGRMLRVVSVIHDRLGGATRQLAYEMTHGLHPSRAGEEMMSLAAELRSIADQGSPASADRLRHLADRAERAARVGAPDRGVQYQALAAVLLHRSDLARNAFGTRGLDVPEPYRGVSPDLVEELSRVRTDLDRLEPPVLDLLIAQGYFLADYHVKLGMPELVTSGRETGDLYQGALAPEWDFARRVVQSANANRKTVAADLERAADRQGIIGATAPDEPRGLYAASLGIGLVVALAAVASAAGAILLLLRWIVALLL